MSKAQVSEADRQIGIVLACKVFPKSDLRLRPLGRRAAEEMAGDDSRPVFVNDLSKDPND
jgi:hypothetical protein